MMMDEMLIKNKQAKALLELRAYVAAAAAVEADSPV
jgi:hypothetical protein